MEKKVFWADDVRSLELIWRARLITNWDVYDEIQLKFNWRKLRSQFRMILCKRTPEEEQKHIRGTCIKNGYINN